MSSIIPEVASALGICLSMMVFAGFYFSRKWHYATAILIGLFALQFSFVFRSAQLKIDNAFPTRGSGISGMRLTTNTVLTMKRLHQLQISPLPDCILDAIGEGKKTLDIWLNLIDFEPALAFLLD